MIATIPVLAMPMNLVHPDLAQPFDDIGRGVVTFEGEFGICMQMMPPALHFE